MCIILTCEKNVRPDYQLIEDCFFSNPDGAGLMWVEDGKVETCKGFTDPSTLMACIDNVPMDTPIVVHMRIATSGGINTGTCHPFPIAKSLDVLHAPNTECDAAVAHNGVIVGMHTDDKLGISDTVSFVKDIIAPSFNGRVTKRIKKMIRNTAPGNRFAILTKDGTVSRIGDGWETVSTGIQASNGSWRHGTSFVTYSDNVYDMAYIEASKMACEGCPSCRGCKDMGTCMAYGPMCDEAIDLADMYEEELLEKYLGNDESCGRSWCDYDWFDKSWATDSNDRGWKEGWDDFTFVK